MNAELTAKIERAFGVLMLHVVPELEQLGIIADIGGPCCGSCGHRELQAKLDANEAPEWNGDMSERGLANLVRSPDDGPFWRGYVFTYSQFLERFRECYADGEFSLFAASRETAEEVAEVATSHGLTAAVSGDRGVELQLAEGVRERAQAVGR